VSANGPITILLSHLRPLHEDGLWPILLRSKPSLLQFRKDVGTDLLGVGYPDRDLYESSGTARIERLDGTYLVCR
jgi:hypothetical protein